MVSAELAVALPALLLVLSLGLGAVGAVADQVRCVDAARAGARLLARGEAVEMVRAEVTRQAPEGARVELTVAPDRVGARVSVDPPAVLSVLGLGAPITAAGWGVPEASFAGVPGDR